jgi:WD40 repeat protein
MAELKIWIRSLVATSGAVVAGPAGAMIGTFLGGIVASFLPGTQDFSNQVFSSLGRMSIDTLQKKLDKQLAPREKQRVNHDLQTAFRDAVREALYDIGGPECFPKLAALAPRDVPAPVVFGLTAPGHTLWQRNDPLAGQVQECMQALEQAIDSQTIFPLDPPQGQTSASVNAYLQAGTPKILADQFYTENFSGVLQHFSALQRELPEFENHLRQHVYDRTLVHLTENLKHRTPAWRAFNRMVLENIQSELSQVASGQSEILNRLKVLTQSEGDAELNTWSEHMADLLAATGTISKQVDEGFEALTDRVVAQHREVVARLDDLIVTSTRIEKKVDRVLRFLEDGKYTIDGEERTVPMPKPPAPGEAPYKGLQYFTEADAGLFFGREKWIARLIARLQGTRFLAIIGASGSGKSSIVRAGVIPVLKGQKELRQVEYRPAHSQHWPVYVLNPSAHPLESLVTAISGQQKLEDYRATLDNLRQDPHVLDQILRQQIQSAHSDHVLLVVDQFEEVFTQCQDAAERAQFINALMDAANPDQAGVAVLLIILRADFYANCAEYEALRAAVSRYQEYIGPLTPPEIRQAITEPAQKLGWKFEPGLVDLIVQDAGQEPGMLPLLSHALLETWRNRSGHTMTLESYAESGGVKGAIAKTAEMVFNQRLTPEQQLTARNIFLRLTNLEEGSQETRRRSSLAELIPAPEHAAAAQKVVQLLAEARLITIEAGAVDVAHEALIREWPKLRGWIEENRAGLRIHHRMAAAAQEWQRFQRDEGLLYRGMRLQEGLEWAKTNPNSMNELERIFLQTSSELEQRQSREKEEQQQRELAAAQKLAAAEKQRAEEQQLAAGQLRRRAYLLRMALIGAGLLAIVAIILAGLASISSTQASQNAIAAQTASTQAVAESFTRATAEGVALNQSRLSLVREIGARSRSLIDRDQDLALLLGIEAVKLAKTYGGSTLSQEAQTSLFQTLSAASFSATLRGHKDSLSTVRFSPDGQKMVTASRDGTAMVWGSDGRRLAVLSGHTGPVTSAAFSPDGAMIVTSGQDGTARLWQVDGKLIRTLEGHSDEINQALFSPDGRQVLTVSNDNTARVWDVASGNFIALRGHSDLVLAGAFSPDGTLVATAGADETVRLWKTDGTPLKTFHDHSSWVVSVQFSPDGQKILSASWDTTAKVWGVDGRLSTTLEGHLYSLNSAAFSPDGRQIVTAGSDNLAKIWSSDGKFQTNLAGHTQQVNVAAFSPDGALIVTASLDNSVRLWQSDGVLLAVLRGHSSFVYDVRFSPDGSHLASASGDLTARLWQTDRLVQIFQDHYGAATTAAFSPDGKLLLTGSTDGNIRLRRQDGVKWDQFYTRGPINRAVFSPNGQQILVASNKNVAILYDLKGEIIQEFQGHSQKVTDARFSPDGSQILTASQDGSAILWRVDGTLLTTLRGHTAGVTSVGFNPKNQTLITTSDDKTARLWNRDGTPLLTLSHPEAVAFASFSPDGTRIVTGSWNGNAYLWKTDGTQLAVLKGHTGGVIYVEFSPDGKLILTASMDATARLWDTNGQLITSLEGHTTWLNSANFSTDGTRIITTSWDGTARVWFSYINSDQMLTEAQQRVGRALDRSECQTYLYLDRCP